MLTIAVPRSTRSARPMVRSRPHLSVRHRRRSGAGLIAGGAARAPRSRPNDGAAAHGWQSSDEPTLQAAARHVGKRSRSAVVKPATGTAKQLYGQFERDSG